MKISFLPKAMTETKHKMDNTPTKHKTGLNDNSNKDMKDMKRAGQ